ncbi:MAG: hypothetical protein GC164_13130 [Phycisphaera sp.]|nr:hypothetical protein [Phycisphaera sp.]
MTRTHVILDGLQDPALAQALSAAWARAGLSNSVDPAGQCAELRHDHMTQSEIDRSAAIARAFGIELRDRAGQAFVADNDLALLREQTAKEYRARLAQALVYLLPAVVLHYVGPYLAEGGGREPSAMLYPWLFEALLVGWACFVGAWPILWQGVAAARHLRATGDLLASVIILLSYLPSVWGTLSLLWQDHAWFGTAGPMCHATAYTVLIALTQRYALHRHTDGLAGRGAMLLRGHARLVGTWLLVMALLFIGVSMTTSIATGWFVSLTFGMLLPPLVSLGAVNRITPGWSSVLPIFAFAVVFVMGKVGQVDITQVRVEVAAGFGLLMTGVMVWGWRGWRTS